MRNTITDSDLKDYAKHTGRADQWESLRSEFDGMIEMTALKKRLDAHKAYNQKNKKTQAPVAATVRGVDAPTGKQIAILRRYGVDHGNMSRKIVSNVISDLFAKNDAVWSYVQLLPGAYPGF